MPAPKKSPAQKPPALPTKRRYTPPKRQLLSEVQSLNIFASGGSGKLHAWAHGLSNWLDEPEEPDDDSVASIIAVSPVLDAVIIGLPDAPRDRLNMRIRQCVASHAAWLQSRDAVTWKACIRSVGALETVVKAVATSMLVSSKRQAENQRTTLPPANDGKKRTIRFRDPNEDIPERFCVNGKPCGPFVGSMTEIVLALEKGKKGRSQFLKKLCDGPNAILFVTESGVSEEKLHAYFIESRFRLIAKAWTDSFPAEVKANHPNCFSEIQHG